MTIEYQELWDNKRKVINMIKDFVKYPTALPNLRYGYVNDFIDKLRKNHELTVPHYNFLKRVLEVEYGIILLDKGDDEKS